MNLIINKNLKWQQDSQNFKYFIDTQLIYELQAYILETLNINHMYRWDKYLKNYKWHVDEYAPEVQDILIQGALNIKCKDHKDQYIISIDPDQIVPGTTAKLDDLCTIINYGTLEVPPYPIFSDAFKYIKNIIRPLYEEFLDSLEEGIY